MVLRAGSGDGGEGEVAGAVGGELVVSECGDHGGVVDAEGHGRHVDIDAAGAAECGDFAAKAGVCGDSAADEEGADVAGGVGLVVVWSEVVDCAFEFDDDGAACGALEGGGQVAFPGVREVGVVAIESAAEFSWAWVAADGVEDGGLEAAVGEVERFALEAGDGEVEGVIVGVGFGGEGVDGGTAGVWQAEDGGDFVEGLADGVVDGSAETMGVGGRDAVVDGGVSAADDQAEGGVAGGDGGGVVGAVTHCCGVEVGVEVVDADEGD